MALLATAFDYAHNNITALELSLSPERLQPYLLRAGGSRQKAIFIHERNTALSEALYGVTQAAEITFRNAIHRALAEANGSMWFDCIELEAPQSEKVTNAKCQITKNHRIVTPGAVISELNLGFWTSLTSARYEKTLWVPYLHKAFPHAVKPKTGTSGGTPPSAPISRSEIFDQLEDIRMLRNRIAHHEPIVKLDLPKLYSRTIEAIAWVCPVTAQWVRSTNCFPPRFHEKPTAYSAPTLPPVAPTPMPGKPRR